MYNNNSKLDEVYLIANLDGKGNVVNYPNVVSYPMGGGSSTNPSIKAHDNLTSAKRSLRFFKGATIIKVTGYEIVKQ